MKKIVVLLLILLLVVGIGLAAYIYISPRAKDPSKITSFEQCLAAGNLVVETQPRECHMEDGRVFTEEGNAAQLEEIIIATAPKAKEKVTTPFKIEGKALGSWFYNEQLSVKLYDNKGNIIATTNPKAQAAISEDELIPFIGVIHFQAPSDSEKGRLIIERTNPVPAEDGKNGPLIIPVRF